MVLVCSEWLQWLWLMTCSFPETQFLQLPGWIRYNVFVATISACFADTLVSLARPAPKCLSLSAENSHCHCFLLHPTVSNCLPMSFMSVLKALWVITFYLTSFDKVVLSLCECFCLVASLRLNSDHRSISFFLWWHSCLGALLRQTHIRSIYCTSEYMTVNINIHDYTHAPRRIVKCPVKYIIIHRYAVAYSSK